MSKLKKAKMEKGITLIALIITIVVLLILAVVTINSIQGDGIIRYAQNAADDYTAQSNQEQEDLNTLLSQIEVSQIKWKKTSEGNLAIGSTVEVNGEVFYVIGGDTAGTEITNSTETVILLAKNNLKTDGSAQDTTGALNPCALMANTEYEVEMGSVDLNDDSTLKEDTTSAFYKAMKYGEKLGATKGRLMTYLEATSLGGNDATKDILYGINGKSSGNYLCYYLSLMEYPNYIYIVQGGDPAGAYDPYISPVDYTMSTSAWWDRGVRPVLEVPLSVIS